MESLPVWSLESGVTPASEVWSPYGFPSLVSEITTKSGVSNLELLRMLEYGFTPRLDSKVWTHSGVGSLESNLSLESFWSLESALTLCLEPRVWSPQ